MLRRAKVLFDTLLVFGVQAAGHISLVMNIDRRQATTELDTLTLLTTGSGDSVQPMPACAVAL
jgi:hypothetical protein